MGDRAQLRSSRIRHLPADGEVRAGAARGRGRAGGRVAGRAHAAHAGVAHAVVVAPPVALFVVGAISMYLGASLAVHLFDEVPVPVVAWLRVVGAAVVLLVFVRPWRRRWSRTELVAAGAFGVATAVMNLCFYLAIDRLPLGTAVAIEFLGPVAVAVYWTRTPRNALALVLAVGGVALLSGIEADGNLAGVLYALAAAACWAAYIVLGARVSRLERGLDGLAVGLAFGAVAIAPVGAWHSAHALTTPRLLLLCVAVGVLSNAVPYALDQVVLRRVTPGAFALLLALLPTTATIVGIVVLGQSPDTLELVGIALVVAALCARDPREGAAITTAASQ